MPVSDEEAQKANALRSFPPLRTSDSGAAAPVLGTNFLGLDDNNTGIPPDTNGAVGPNHIVTMINSQVRIANRSGGTVSTVALDTFWSSVTGGSGAFDPRLFYDAAAGRWIAAACAHAQAINSGIVIGASATNDPTGTWYLFAFDADATDVNWFDYPGLGYNSSYVVVTGNLYTLASDFFAGMKTFVFNKANLYANSVAGAVQSGVQTGIGGTIMPAQTLDVGVSTIYAVSRWNGNSGGFGFIRLATIDPTTGLVAAVPNPGSSNGLISTSNTWASFTSGDFAPQATIADLIDAGDDRIQNVVLRNSKLWLSHIVLRPASTPTRSGIQWWQLQTNGTVAQNALIEDLTNATFYSYPSIAVNSAEHVVIGHSIFSATTFASAGYSYRAPTDTLNTMRAPQLFKSGVGPYLKTFSGPSNRWGDYSVTMVDPTSDTDFWTLQEYAAAPTLDLVDAGRWSVWWAKITQEGALPTVTITASDPAAAEAPLDTGTFTITRTGSTAASLVVAFAVTGTATSGSDYLALTSPVTIPAASASVNVTVTPLADALVEPPETVIATLVAAPAYYVIGTPNAATVTIADAVTSAAVKGDFNGDGKSDIVLRNYTTGQNALWIMNGTTLSSTVDLPALANTAYRFEGTAEFNGDGKTDLVLRNYTTGQNALWLMNGTSLSSVVDLPALPNTAYHFEGTGDFNGDGKADIILRNYTTGQNALWLMNGTALSSIVDLPALPNTAYKIESAADFNGDGKIDIVLRNYTTGQNALWLMNGTSLVTIVDLPALPNTAYRFDGVGDFNGDGKPDIVLRNYTTGQNAVWLMNGTTLSSIVDLPALPNTAYEINGPR